MAPEDPESTIPAAALHCHPVLPNCPSSLSEPPLLLQILGAPHSWGGDSCESKQQGLGPKLYGASC